MFWLGFCCCNGFLLICLGLVEERNEVVGLSDVVFIIKIELILLVFLLLDKKGLLLMELVLVNILVKLYSVFVIFFLFFEMDLGIFVFVF